MSEKEISAALVMKLRQTSGLPMMKCKEALEATEKKDREVQKRIEDLGQRLNAALDQRLRELSNARGSSKQ